MSASKHDCAASRARMARAFDGTLAVEERLELEEHAGECSRCGAEWGRTRALVDALQGLPEAPIGGLDLEAVSAAVNARIDGLPKSAQGSPVGRRLRWAAAVAAGALAMGAAWTYLGEPQSGTGETGDRAPHAMAEDSADGEGASALPEAQPDPLSGAESSEQVAAAPAGNAGPSGVELAPLPEILEVWPEYDSGRRNEVLAQVEGRLADALGPWDPAAPAAPWASEFLESTADLVAAGWPMDGLLRSLVDSAAAPNVRAAALRVAGSLGGRSMVSKVEGALDDPNLAPVAAQTLLDLWPDGRRALARAWWRPDLRPGLQAELLLRSAELRRSVVQDALQAPGRSQERFEGTSDLASLLVGAGEEGVHDLVLLLGRSELDSEAVLAWMAEASGPLVANVVAELANRTPSPLKEPQLLAVAGASGSTEVLGWVLERAQRSRHREDVVHALAQFRSLPALEAMVHLEASRRVDPEAFLEAFGVAASRAPEELDELAALYLRRGSKDSARRLLDLCVTTESRKTLAATLRLCADALLPAPERRDALVALAERLEEDDLPALQALFENLGAGDGPVGAAVLLLAAELRPERGPAELLALLSEDLSGSRLRRLTERIERSAGFRRADLYTLTNLLEPCLEARALRVNSNLENL